MTTVAPQYNVSLATQRQQQALSERIGFGGFALALYAFALTLTQATDYWRIATAVAVLAPLAFLFRPRIERWHFTFGMFCLVGFIVWIWISALLSQYPEAAFHATFYLTQVYAFLILTVLLVRSSHMVPFLLKAITLGCLALSCATVILGLEALEGFGPRALGVARQENALGHTLAYGWAASFILWFAVRRHWRLIVAANLVAAIVALVASGSRGAAVMVAVVVVSFVLLEYVKNIRANFKVILPALLTVAAVPLLLIRFFPDNPIVSRFTRLLQDGIGASEMARLELIQHAWGLFLSNPVFGTGAGTLIFTHGRFTNTHTSYMELLYSGGIVAFVLHYALVAYVFLSIGRIKKFYINNIAGHRYLSAMQAFVVGWVALGFFVPAARSRIGTLIFGIILAVTMRYIYLLIKQRQAARQ